MSNKNVDEILRDLDISLNALRESSRGANTSKERKENVRKATIEREQKARSSYKKSSSLAMTKRSVQVAKSATAQPHENKYDSLSKFRIKNDGGGLCGIFSVMSTLLGNEFNDGEFANDLVRSMTENRPADVVMADGYERDAIPECGDLFKFFAGAVNRTVSIVGNNGAYLEIRPDDNKEVVRRIIRGLGDGNRLILNETIKIFNTIVDNSCPIVLLWIEDFHFEGVNMHDGRSPKLSLEFLRTKTSVVVPKPDKDIPASILEESERLARENAVKQEQERKSTGYLLQKYDADENDELLRALRMSVMTPEEEAREDEANTMRAIELSKETCDSTELVVPDYDKKDEKFNVAVAMSLSEASSISPLNQSPVEHANKAAEPAGPTVPTIVPIKSAVNAREFSWSDHPVDFLVPTPSQQQLVDSGDEPKLVRHVNNPEVSRQIQELAEWERDENGEIHHKSHRPHDDSEEIVLRIRTNQKKVSEIIIESDNNVIGTSIRLGTDVEKACINIRERFINDGNTFRLRDHV